MPIYGQRIVLVSHQRDLSPETYGCENGLKTSKSNHDHYSFNALQKLELYCNRTRQKMLWNCHFLHIYSDLCYLNKMWKSYSSIPKLELIEKDSIFDGNFNYNEETQIWGIRKNWYSKIYYLLVTINSWW